MCANTNELLAVLEENAVDVVLIDQSSEELGATSLKAIQKSAPRTKVVA